MLIDVYAVWHTWQKHMLLPLCLFSLSTKDFYVICFLQDNLRFCLWIISLNYVSLESICFPQTKPLLFFLLVLFPIVSLDLYMLFSETKYISDVKGCKNCFVFINIRHFLKQKAVMNSITKSVWYYIYSIWNIANHFQQCHINITLWSVGHISCFYNV